MREVDSDFAPNEQLYLRFNQTHIPKEYAATNQLPLNAVRFPDFSVNRGKYSLPEDVLKPKWPNYGIATFQVQDIPKPIIHVTDIFSFQVEHVPTTKEEHPTEGENYAHSEVRTYRNGGRSFKSQTDPVPKIVRSQFRAFLREGMKILRQPEAEVPKTLEI